MMKQSRYIRLIVCVAGAVIAFSSCKIGKKYARPELCLPLGIVAGADTSSVDDIPWQNLYTDTTLQRLITVALDNNKDMQIAAAKIKELLTTNSVPWAGSWE